MSKEFKVRPVVGFEDKLLITSDGRVFRKTRIGGKVRPYTYVKRGYLCNGKYTSKTLKGNWLKPQFNGNYYHIMLPNRKVKVIHRLVAETFIPNPDNKPQINHKDGNKLNNNIDNLEWVTSKENIVHAVKTGLTVATRGDANHFTRIPESELINIKTLYLSGMPQHEIAKKYGVHQSHISRIVNNHKRGRVTLCQI